LANNKIPNCQLQLNEYQCDKCDLHYTLSENKESCKSNEGNLIYRNCAMVSSIMCHSFENIYQDWFLMHRNDQSKISDNLFLKELRRTKSQGNITIPNIYEQIVLARKDNIDRVKLLGSGVKFQKTIAGNVSAKCDLFVTDNEYYDLDQAALISGAVTNRSYFGSFAFKIFEEVESNEYFLDKKVCKKGILRMLIFKS
jgi:hypothetical protein